MPIASSIWPNLLQQSLQKHTAMATGVSTVISPFFKSTSTPKCWHFHCYSVCSRVYTLSAVQSWLVRENEADLRHNSFRKIVWMFRSGRLFECLKVTSVTAASACSYGHTPVDKSCVKACHQSRVCEKESSTQQLQSQPVVHVAAEFPYYAWILLISVSVNLPLPTTDFPSAFFQHLAYFLRSRSFSPIRFRTWPTN